MVKQNKINDYGRDRYIEYWHRNCLGTYINGNFSISVSCTSGGCGLVSLFRWINSRYRSTSEEIQETLQYIHKQCKANSVGAIICQVGESFYNENFTKILEKLGYTYIEYKNPLHAPNKQRLYMKQL